MRSPTTAELLDTWERMRDATMARRAAALVALARPELTPEEIGALPLGGRDRLLLELRRLLFGRDVHGVIRCPACAEMVETPFVVDDLTASADSDPSAPVSDPRRQFGRCDVDAWQVEYRAPTCADAVALAEADRPSARTLVSRCVTVAAVDGSPVDRERLPDALPQIVISEIARGIAAIDPGADILLDLRCPACAHAWSPPFDAASFVWTEITGWARRTLREVASLARAFGWREADILAMSPHRRADYLELLGA